MSKTRLVALISGSALAIGLGLAQEAPRVATILRSGKLVQIGGTAGSPQFEADPPTTHYLQFAQSAHSESWAATTGDSLVVGYKGKRYRVALGGTPRALAISPGGLHVGVFVKNTMSLYFPFMGTLQPSKRIDASALGLADSSMVELTVTNTTSVWLTTPDKQYFAGQDNVFAPAGRRLAMLRPLSSGRGSIGYDAKGKAVFLVQNGKYEQLAGSDDGIGDVSGIEVTEDGKTIWVSQSGKQNLMRIATESHEVHGYELEGVGGALRPSAVRRVFVWSEDSLVDVTGAVPKVVKVAAAKRKE
jgi:hypothetical protein